MNGISSYSYRIAILLVAFASLHCEAASRDLPTFLSDSNSYESSTHLYVYSYALTNPVGSNSPVDTLVVKLQPGVDVVTGLEAPAGWRAFYSEEKSTVMWAAVGYLDPEQEDPSGDIPVSDFAILPGQTLHGFSFKSFGPPGSGVAITQNYAPLTELVSDEDFENVETLKELSTLPEDNGYRLTTIVPVPDLDWTGNRRPAVDGFLVFANIEDNSAFSGSALIVFRVGSAGETVDISTLQVSLNGSDVTSGFAWDEGYNGYAASFEPLTSPIRPGNNVLITTIEGVVPGTTDRTARDTDRVTFEFTP